MRVSLFIPCLVDQFSPQVGVNQAKILRKLGLDVDYPLEQTCCGQPAFNTGYRAEAEELAERFLKIFENAEYVVTPSGSCCSMVKVFYPELIHDKGLRHVAQELRKKTFEFSEFLVNVLGVTDLGARFPHTVTYHDSCHLSRELGIKEQPRQLLKSVQGLQLIEMEASENCCGFGGTFSVKFPDISTAMVEDKAKSIVASGAEFVVANDAGCLMHIGGWLSRNNIPVKPIHLAELLGASL